MAVLMMLLVRLTFYITVIFSYTSIGYSALVARQTTRESTTTRELGVTITSMTSLSSPTWTYDRSIIDSGFKEYMNSRGCHEPCQSCLIARGISAYGIAFYDDCGSFTECGSLIPWESYRDSITYSNWLSPFCNTDVVIIQFESM
jgi:hypothetical protein